MISTRPAYDEVDPAAMRMTLGHFTSGVTIIAGHDGIEPLGFTCQSFYSVSLEPPLVSFSVMTDSTTYPRIRKTEQFSVNVLASHQHEASSQFARSGTDKWMGVRWPHTTVPLSSKTYCYGSTARSVPNTKLETISLS